MEAHTLSVLLLACPLGFTARFTPPPLLPSLFLVHRVVTDVRFAIVPMTEQIPRLLATILKAKEDPDHKIIVFFVAARIVQASYMLPPLFLNMVLSPVCKIT